MKKVFTILFSIAVLFSGMKISYSAHYCQGSFIDSILSLTGKNADCGMNQHKSENKDVRFSDLMCVNEITSYTLCNNYVYSQQLQVAGNQLQFLELPTAPAPKINLIPASGEVRIFPPGHSRTLKSDSEVLCVFRI